MDLHLVQQPGPEQRLRGTGPVHHDGPAAGRGPGLRGAVRGVGDEPGAARRDVPGVDVVGQYEDRHAVVMIALPAPGQLEGAPPGDDRAGRQRLTEHLPARAVGEPVIEPVEQPEAVPAELLAGPVVRAGDEAVQGHRHIQPDHRVHPYCTSYRSSSAPGDSSVRASWSSVCSGPRSPNSRRPWPNRTGTSWISSTSSTRARRAARAV